MNPSPLVWIILLSGSAYLGVLVFLWLGLRRAVPKNDSSEKLPTVAVVCAARNEAENLPSFLEGLLAQDYPADKLTFFVADDRSTDATPEILTQYARREPRLHIIRIKETIPEMTPKKYALSQCIQQARAEIICSVDADIRVPPTWVRSMVQAFGPTTGVVAGFAGIRARNWFEALQALDFLGLMAAGAGAIQHGLTWSASGMNLAYRRSLFAAVDGFWPVAKLLSGDDVYLIQAIGGIPGYRATFQFSPESFVETNPQPTLKALLQQRIRWASNSRYQWRQRPGFFVFLTSAFLFNLGLLINPLLAIFSWPWWVSLLAFKALGEGLMLFTGARIFRRKELLKWFPLWFVFQIPYVVLTGLAGVRGRYSWKGNTA